MPKNNFDLDYLSENAIFAHDFFSETLILGYEK